MLLPGFHRAGPALHRNPGPVAYRPPVGAGPLEIMEA